MSRFGWKTWVAYAVSIAVLIAGVGLLVHDQRQRDPFATSDPVAPLAAMPFTVSLSNPGPSRATVGTSLTLTATGYSPEPISTIELYEGARLIDSATPDADGVAVLQYAALRPGDRLLHARAVDRGEQVAFSAAVPLRVVPTPQESRRGVPVQPVGTETVGQLAARLGIKASDLSLQAPGGPITTSPAPDTLIPEDTAVVATVTSDPATQPRTEIIAASPATTGGRLEAAATECRVSLTAIDVGAKVTYLENTPEGWVELGTRGTNRSFVVDDLSTGAHVFAARPAGPGRAAQQTPPVSVTAPPACAAESGWTGDARIINGTLIIDPPITTSSGIYFYLQTETQPGRRSPGHDTGTFTPAQVIDVSRHLPRLAGRSVKLDVWQVQGEFATRLAGGELKVPTGKTLADVIGQPSMFSLAYAPGTVPLLVHDDAKIGFEWVADSPHVDRVVWQVLAAPVSTTNLSLVPDGLLASGTSLGTGGDDQRQHGTFEVDTALIPGHEEVAGAKPAAAGPAIGTPPVTAMTLTDLGSGSYLAKPPKVPDNATILAQGYVKPPGPGEPVYVRALAAPTSGGVTAAAGPLDIVLPRVESPAAGDRVQMEVEEFGFEVGRSPNPGLGGCARVTVPWNFAQARGIEPLPKSEKTVNLLGSSVTIQAEQTFDEAYGPGSAWVAKWYPQSGTYCPGDWPPPASCSTFFCDFVNGVISLAEAVVSVVLQVYDLVAAAYNGIIKGVVTLVQKGLCSAITAADEKIGSGCEDIVGVATQAAISAVLAAYGLPPSLPSSTALTAVAKGEFELLAVELMKSHGVPCDELSQAKDLAAGIGVVATEAGADGAAIAAVGDPCLAMARLLIGQVKSQVLKTAQTSYSKATGLPSPVGFNGQTIKDLEFAPEPKGQADPWVISIVLRPRRAAAESAGLSCHLELEGKLSDGAWYHEWEQTVVADQDGVVRADLVRERRGGHDVSGKTEVLRLTTSGECVAPATTVSDVYEPAQQR